MVLDLRSAVRGTRVLDTFALGWSPDENDNASAVGAISPPWHKTSTTLEQAGDFDPAAGAHQPPLDFGDPTLQGKPVDEVDVDGLQSESAAEAQSAALELSAPSS
eukprot:7391721-Prymnesium_polylepis.2